MLVNSLNLNEIEWTPIGESENFYGVFDGGNNYIYNLKISDSDIAGLFGSVAGNAKIINLNTYGGNISTSGVAGAIVANLYDSAIIENCTNNIDVKTSNDYAGGIAGALTAGTIEKTYNNGTVECNDYESSTDAVGAVIGQCTNTSVCTISNCYYYSNIEIKGIGSDNIAEKKGVIEKVLDNILAFSNFKE